MPALTDAMHHMACQVFVEDYGARFAAYVECTNRCGIALLQFGFLTVRGPFGGRLYVSLFVEILSSSSC